jgi:WD40 repeat protein
MMATDPSSEQIAYAAGAVVVIYNYRRNKQVAFLYPPASVTNAVPGSNNVPPVNNPLPNFPAWSANAHPSAAEWASPSALGNDMNYGKQTSDEEPGKKRTSAGTRPKTISCLAFSSDGNYLAAGEVGHQPRIFVWNVKQQSLVCVLKGHKFGIVSVAFSSNMRHLASVGFQHDGYLNVWNWRKGIKVASNRVTSRVNAMAFSKDGSHFITAGLRHIKFWNLNSTTGKQPQGVSPI